MSDSFLIGLLILGMLAVLFAGFYFIDRSGKSKKDDDDFLGL